MPKVKEEAKKEEKTTESKEQVKTEKSEKVKAAVKQDTGSVDFQIKNFSDKITSLTKHLQEHKHDYDSRRGLLIMVGKRRRLLNYIKQNDQKKYEDLVAKLKLKK